uniref:1-acylglycerol-3-phosphate O-acyltransferase n=1 Tax=Quercus lobata TaxID=97700 RepID=A0A7N2M479_QUELO
MAIAAAVVIVPLGILFFVSGLIINLIQAICFVLIRPLSKSTYRRINRLVAELLWLELVWLIDWWAGVKIQVYTDQETFKLMGKEHALVICNHKSDIDWLIGWVLAQRSGCLGSAIAVMKKSSKLLPVIASKYGEDLGGWCTRVGRGTRGCELWRSIRRVGDSFFPHVVFELVMSEMVASLLFGWKNCFGKHSSSVGNLLSETAVIGWSMWFSEYLFLERSWAKDESTLKSGLQRLEDYPQPFWLALFVEGTRFTQAKLLAAQEYAASAGLPVPRNVLIPRTKGFVSAVSQMRSFVPAIYDITVAIPKSSPAPTMLRLFKGQPSVMHVHIKRHLMKDLPETDEAVAQWCKDIFVVKDALLDKHVAEDTFSDQELQDTGRPIKSLLVVTSWACLLIYGALKFLHWSSLLYSWKGIAFSAVGMALITFLMNILIRFSQSERSTPAKIAPAKPKNGGEHLETISDKQH